MRRTVFLASVQDDLVRILSYIAHMSGSVSVAQRFVRELRDYCHHLAALPGNRFEALKGKRKGQYSIRINDQWRVCFEWPEKSPGPTNIEIVDYH